MWRGTSGTVDAAELRRRAEEQALSLESREVSTALSLEEARQILHELRVHQIELELQNEELRRAQSELETSQARYFDLYDLAPVGYFTLSGRGLILEANLTAATMLGVPRGALVNQPIAHFVMREDQDVYYLHQQRLFETEQPQVFELRMVTNVGAPFWTHIEATLARDAEGASMCRAVMSDVAERKRVDAELLRYREHLEALVSARTADLEAANRELESFLYSVSHDFRTPLRAIDGFSSKLAARPAVAMDDEARRLIRVVRDNSAKMSQLIDNILAFSGSGRMTMRLVEVDMAQLVRDAWQRLKPSRAERQLSLDLKPIVPAHGDLAMLRLLWANLLANAVKFTGPVTDAQVEVGGSRSGEACTYYIKDNGVGFDPVYEHKLFGVFQRLHGVDEFEGTGIGLAVVKRIVSRHGGWITAEGKIGQGATVRFSLPIERREG